MSKETPILYVVATPIGNLGDITQRAIDTLSKVEVILCEDTRHSKKLLQNIGVDKKLIAYHDHSTTKERQKILSLLAEGKDLALISDAGTPVVSDPGYRLISEAIEAGVKIVPIPGASAVIAALSASGLPSDRFSFIGFAPHKSRDNFVDSLNLLDGTIIFYESPARLKDMLERLAKKHGDRQAVIAREMTKLHEELIRGSVQTLLEILSKRESIKGEVTILLAPYGADLSDEAIMHELKALLSHEPLRSAVDKVADDMQANRRRVYQIALRLKDGEDS